MKPFYFSKLVFPILILLGINFNAVAQTTTYNYTGTQQTYIVPAGVTALSIDATGGGGGYPYWQCSGTASYAPAGRVQCALAVTPGMTLYIYVGGKGGSAPCSNGTIQIGGFNGGISGSNYAGASGGGTDIRFSAGTITTYSGGGSQVLPYTATNRVVVAGGGGGGADWYGTGGNGGGLVAGTGIVGTSGGVGGTGGTQSGGGVNGNTGTLGVGGTRVSYTGGGGGYWGGGSGTGVSGGGGGGSSYTDPTLCTSVIHTQGYAPAVTDGRVIITVLCTSPGSVVGTFSACVGGTTELTNPTASVGVWTSSNTSIATVGSATGIVTGVAPGTVTITHLQSNPCGGVSASASVTINPTPAPIVGPSTLCTGASSTFTDATTGGTWTISGSAASISGTGVATGVAVGSGNITYTLPAGCFSTTGVVVNTTPFVYNVTGGGNYCSGTSGVHIGLNTSTAGINYQVFLGGTSVGSLTGTGAALDFGLYTTTGTYTVLATNPSTGCTATMSGSAVVGFNPLPAPIGGVANVCVGSTSTLTNATTGGTWSSSTPSVAAIGLGTGVVTGMAAGSATITYTVATTGCMITTPFVVNTLPAPIAGPTNICVGATMLLTNATSGGTWSSASTTTASVVAGGGAVTGVAAGSTTISYSLFTGCYVTAPMVVNPLPLTYTMTGGGNYCADGAGVHIGLVYSNSGVDYQLLNFGSNVGAPVSGSNAGLDFGLQMTPGSYTVRATNPLTGCTRLMTGSLTVNTNPLPAVYDVTGGGGYCLGGTGRTIGVNHSDVGIKYQLYNGLTPVGSLVSGTGFALNFGLNTAAGIYSVVAINPVTGCTSIMNSSATITVNSLPVVYTVTGGGHYCATGAGVNIGLSGSDAGTTYTLRRGTTVVATVTSPGGPLDFGQFTTAGTYTVSALDGLGCGNNMAGSTTVVIDPLPVVYSVTGGGGYCDGGTGVHIGVLFSTAGTDYQLYYSGGMVGSPVHGSGSGLDFGIFTNPGVYNVVATNLSTGCATAMGGTATISVNPLPFANAVTGGGSYCLTTSGVHVGTDLSEFGINYQLYRGTTAVGLVVPGTGGGLDFGLFTTPGTYTVVARNPVTGCLQTQTGSATISINPLPASYVVSGGGSYCASDAGRDVVLSSSEIGVDYELFNGPSTGIILTGTGTTLHFGLQTLPGTYTVKATNPLTGCTKLMTGSAMISVNTLPNAYNVTGGGNYCFGGSGVHIGLDGSTTGITYQLYNSLNAMVGPALAGSGGVLDFGLKTVADNYYVVARNTLTTCTNMMIGTASVGTNPLPADYPVTGGGPYCAGGTAPNVVLSGSDINFEYQLYRGGVAVGGVEAGTGVAIDFGPQATAGTYTVRAKDMLTGCTKNMPGSAIVVIISNTSYLVTGGGNYCAGGTGVHVGLSGSSSGVDYQLWAGTVGAMGTALSGGGSSLDFGLQTIGDVYRIVATNTTYGCTDTMAGSVTVVINPLPTAYNLTGGGSYCATGTGLHVGLSNSDGGIMYQLYNGVTTSGPALPGIDLPLDFGLKTADGTYTVIATNSTTGCSSNMTGSSAIIVKPLPTAYRDSVTGFNSMYPGYFCAADTTGVHILLESSDAGVLYQLWRGSIMVGGTVTGSGSTLDLGRQLIAGTYTITAMDPATGCSNTMLGSSEVHIIPLPTVHNVTGGGSFCPGGAGVHIMLDGSEAGYFYQLRGSVKVSPVTLFGTGGILDFGLLDTTGTYTVLANNVITTCLNDMFGSASVANDTILTPTVTIRAYPGTGINVWHVDSMRVSVTNAGTTPTYQWYINGHLIAGATNASFTNHEFFNNDSVSCMVTASGPCGGNTTVKSLIITLHNVGVNTITASNADIRLMPNPNKGTFSVKGTMGSNIDEEVTLEVVNMMGQVVYSNKVMTQNGSIDQQIQLGNVANGMYLMNLRSASQHTVFHFVIEQ